MDPVLVPRDRLFLGHGPVSPLLVKRDDLVTHAVILGRTGSGKTGLGIGLVEELALSRIPVIVVDPKGDMTNLALAFPGLEPDALAPWTDPAREPKAEAARWRQGLIDSGQAPERVRVYREAARTTVYAPGWTGAPEVPRVDVLPSLRPPRGLSDEARAEQARGIVSALLGAAGVEADGADPRHVLLVELVLHRWSRGEDATLDGLVGGLSDPPFQQVGPMAVDRFLSPNERDRLARGLVGFCRSASRWLGGTPLDMDLLLERPAEGQPARTSIFTLSHLESDAERQFFLTLLLDALVGWMTRQGGTSQLRAALVIEEARGLLPPHPHSPPTKAPLARLLAQSRAFGLGVVLSTQHPVDLDYKALSNVGAWFLGALRDRDLQRDLDTELRDRGVDPGSLAALEKRQFLAVTPESKPVTFRARWALSYLRGPIAPAELPRLARLMDPPPAAKAGARAVEPRQPEPSYQAYRAEARVEPVLAPASPAAALSAAVLGEGPFILNQPGAPWGDVARDPWAGNALPFRTTLLQPKSPSNVPVRSTAAASSTVWRPSLFARAHLVFTRPRLPQAYEVDVLIALPLADQTSEQLDWARGARLDPGCADLGPPRGWHKFEEVPPAAFELKTFVRLKRDIEEVLRARTAWTLDVAPAQVQERPEAVRREELRKRVAQALTSLGAPGPDLGLAVAEAVLGASSPVAVAAGAAPLEALARWAPPPDARARLERLQEALVAATRAPSKPASSIAGGLLVSPQVRVDEVGLLWTPAKA